MSFYTDVIARSAAFRSDVVCKDMALLEPGTRAAVLALVADAKAAGHDLRVLETYRSQTRQGALFLEGATKLQKVGCHGYGVAVDFGVFVNDAYQPSNGPYVFLREMARKHGLISGQDWGHARTGSFVDSGHVQRVPVWRQTALFSGSWYPDSVYDPYQDSAKNGQSDVVGSLAPAPRPVPPIVRPAPVAGPAMPPAVIPGSSGVDVQRIQSMLGCKVTGTYVSGSETEWAIRLFQVRHDLTPDGRIGDRTWGALLATSKT
jgi:hypothetical protein